MKKFSGKQRQRGAFTLTELLVVIMIIGVIAAALLVAVAGAQESARTARTRSIVAKIHQYLLQRWETYISRPTPQVLSPYRPPMQWPPPTLPPPNDQPPPRVQLRRLDAVRELMRMEMPERFSDIENPPRVLSARPALSRRYNRRLANAQNTNTDYEQAECLYMIIASFEDHGGRALDDFTSSEIGDVNENGLPEILDAWGTPIGWLRWAPGYRSPVQYGPRQAPDDPKFSPDPFDYLKVHHLVRADQDPLNDPYALFPLVYSAGPDEKYGIRIDDPGLPSGEYRRTGPRPNDPYDPDDDAATEPVIGSRLSDGWEDNIDSHFSLNE